MTVPSTAQTAGPFIGNGVTTAFPFSFKCFDRTHLQWVVAEGGVETTKVLDSDYSVTLNPDQDALPGGTVTYPLTGSPMSATSTATLVGSVPLGQTVDLPVGGRFSPSDVELALDLLGLQAVQTRELAGRSLKLPVTAFDANPTLPPPLANNVIGWDEDAQALRNFSPEVFASVVVAGSAFTNLFSGNGATTSFTLSADPGSVNALAVAIGGVVQTNGVDFTLSGTTLTFTSAPPAGSSNIVARYTAAVPSTVAYAQDVNYTPAGGGTPTTVAARLDSGPVLATSYPTLAAALATGRDVEVPTGTTVSGAGIILSTPGQRIFGGGTITWSDPTQHLFTVTANDVEIAVRRVNGTATSATNSTFAIFTSAATPVTGGRVRGVLFSGASAPVGCNNGIKLDTACNDWQITGNRFERLWGTASGFGYGVLLGATDNVTVAGNTFAASSGRGRHGIYLSAGCTNCKVYFNNVRAFAFEGITLYSQGAQPANTDNLVAYNYVSSCCVAVPGASTGNISVFGHALRTDLVGNVSVNSRGCGIKLDGTGVTDLRNTNITGGTVANNDYIGIDLLAAVGGSLRGVTVSESSVVSAGAHSNIRLASDGTTATSGWLISGNNSSGSTTARSAFRLDATAPTPTGLDVFGNKFDTCFTTDIELNGIACAIDGYLRATAAVNTGAMANASSYVVPGGVPLLGAAPGDQIRVTTSANTDGCVLSGNCVTSDVAQVTVVNLSGGVKTINATFNVEAWKRSP